MRRLPNCAFCRSLIQRGPAIRVRYRLSGVRYDVIVHYHCAEPARAILSLERNHVFQEFVSVKVTSLSPVPSPWTLSMIG